MKKERILSFIYQKTERQELKMIDLNLIGPRTKFQLTYQGGTKSAYTTMTGKEKDIFRVVIGGQMVAEVAHLPDVFTTKESLKPFIKPIKKAFKGLNYHEMGHVLFSDMSLKELLKYDEKYKGFVLNLFNILEDPIIELNIIKYVEKNHPHDVSPRYSINFIKNQLFIPKCEDYTYEEDIGNFMNYLLLVLRCGKKSIPETNMIYEKYSETLIPKIKNILGEPDATIRQTKTVELADWIIHNITEFDWSEVEAPDDLKPSPSSSGSSPMKSSSSGLSRRLSGEESGAGDKESGSSSRGGHGEEEAEEEKEKGDTEEDKDESDDKKEDSDVENDYVPDLDDCFNDCLNCSYSHEFVIAKDEYTITNPDELERGINEQLEKSKDCVQNISKFLTLFKGRKKPRITGGFTSGKLDVRAAMQDEARDGCETKLFTRTIPRGRSVDLAVSLVCDNSGSMAYDKSTLASIGALALAQACEWSKVPFECSCFTKTHDGDDGTSITIIEKELNETFEKAKPYFGINDYNLIHYLHSERYIPTFRGNSEEVNLFHIGNEFVKCGHTTKLMFVFCDGQTTGSQDSLKQVIKRLEKMGIHVIGIGLMSSDVKESYTHYKVFNSYDQLQRDLAPYLVETLSKFATK